MLKALAHEQYIADVLADKIVTSKLIRLALERHQNDLSNGHLRNLTFGRAKAQHVITFIESFCHHSQGEWCGQPVKLAPWQQALLWIMYGWRWTDTGYTAGSFGDGVTVNTCPQTVIAAILLMTGHLYEHRETVSELSLKEIPLGAKALLDTIRCDVWTFDGGY